MGAYRILKPGGKVGAWQWMLQPHFDYGNETQMEWKRGMEYGGGLRNLNKPAERAKEFEIAGFKDLGMGIGGPMRRMVERIGCTVTGVTICKHQIERAHALTPPEIEDKVTYIQS